MEQFVCNNLAVGYDGTIVQKDINLTINKGDYICVMGKNGAGKTTFMKTFLGLLPAIFGKIEYGQGIKSTDIGYLPQQTQIQKDFPASVWEVVLSGFANSGNFRFFYSKSQKEHAINMLKKTGADHLRKKSYSKLSGGQQQRVLLARALCSTSKVVLLDEPTAGLDTNSTEGMYELIKKLNDEGITIIMISHDVKNAVSYANYVLNFDEDVRYMKQEDYLKLERGEL